MKLIIDIPDGLWEILQDAHNGSVASATVLKAAKSGVPLIKGVEPLIIKLIEDAAESED